MTLHSCITVSHSLLTLDSSLFISCRHSKKKKRHDSRQEERDFFLPLLERMNSSDNPRISDLDISPTSELPSLTEICLSVVLQNSLSEFAYTVFHFYMYVMLYIML